MIPPSLPTLRTANLHLLEPGGRGGGLRGFRHGTRPACRQHKRKERNWYGWSLPRARGDCTSPKVSASADSMSVSGLSCGARRSGKGRNLLRGLSSVWTRVRSVPVCGGYCVPRARRCRRGCFTAQAAVLPGGWNRPLGSKPLPEAAVPSVPPCWILVVKFRSIDGTMCRRFDSFVNASQSGGARSFSMPAWSTRRSR